MNASTLLVVGLILFLAGGAVLAFAGASMGTPLGTVIGLAGLALMIWGWLRRSSEPE